MPTNHASAATLHIRRKRIARAVAAALLAVVVVSGLLAFRTASDFLSGNQWMFHTHEVIENLRAVQITLLDTESGMRGYVLTGDPQYLEPYDAGRTRLAQLLSSLDGLVADNSEQSARSTLLRQQVDTKLARLAETGAVLSRDGTAAATQAVASGDGKRHMDAVRATLSAMEAAESRLLEERERSAAANLRQTRTFLVVAVMLTVGLLAFAGGLVERDFSDSERRLDAEGAARVAAVRDRTDQTHAVRDSIIDAIITIDERGIVETVNAATLRLFGYDEAAVVGQNVRMLMPPPDRDQHDEYLVHYRATGERKIIGIGREVTACRSDGTLFPVDLAVSETNVEGRRLFTGVLRDLTDRKKAEREMRELKRLVDERARLADIGAVTAQIVHDLGNPIAGLSMRAQRLTRAIGRAPQQAASTLSAMADQILDSIQRLNDLLDELRDFSRQQRLDLVPLNPVRLLGAVRDQWLPVAEAHGIRMSIDVGVSLPAVVADEAKLFRVLDNLVKNAIEAMGTGPGEVRLAVATSGQPMHRLRISVSDNGSGIPESIDVFRLFETTKANGSGLGLSIARRIVEAHGGGLSFARRQPNGTAFHIISQRTPQPQKRILLLDDDEEFRLALAETLRDDGYDVLDYAAPDAMPAMAGLGTIAALVTDYRMPNGDGLSVAEQFHARHAAAPVLLVTSYTTAFLEAQVAARPYIRLMRKPIDYDALLALMPR